MFKTTFLQKKNVNNFETLGQIFLYLRQKILRALQFYMCKFEGNRDYRTCWTNSWSDLTFKYNANTCVKVDAREQTRETAGGLLSILSPICKPGYSCPKLQFIVEYDVFVEIEMRGPDSA